MSVIGVINKSRHAFSSIAGGGSKSQVVLRDDMHILLTSAVVVGSNENI